MKRRTFLKSSCRLCLLGSAGIAIPGLLSCSPAYPVFKTTVEKNNISIPLSLFSQSAIVLIRPNGWYYEIAVHQQDKNTYTAVLMQCTHQNTQLTLEGNHFHCSLHGSKFTMEGNVNKGPAELALKKYTSTIENNQLIIAV
jgi:Rieske Fe-S protein